MNEECLRRVIKERETYCAELLKEKKSLFEDLYIPFPTEIKVKLYEAANQGNRNCALYLDNMCHSYIKYALENYPQIMFELLLTKTQDDIVTQKTIEKAIGKYGFEELAKSGLIKPYMKRNKIRGYYIR